MEKTMEIPGGIWGAAIEAAALATRPSKTLLDAVEPIARAILAERERCAKIAGAHVTEPGLSDNPAYVRFEPSDFTAKKIAAAIRNQP